MKMFDIEYIEAFLNIWETEVKAIPSYFPQGPSNWYGHMKKYLDDEQLLSDIIDGILNGKNPVVNKTFGENTEKAIEILKNIFDTYMNSDYHVGECIELCYALCHENGLESLMRGHNIAYGPKHNWTYTLPITTIKFLCNDTSYNSIEEGKHSYGYGCSKIYFWKDNPNFISEEALVKIALLCKTKLVQYGEKENEPTTYIMPEGLVSWEEDDDVFGLIIRKGNYQKVICPSTLRYIGGVDVGPFYKNKNINEVILNDGLIIIGNGAFSLSSLKSLTIPESVREIRSSAFCDTNIEILNIPETVLTIEQSAFSYCKHLKKASISAKVVREYAFDNSGLEDVEVGSTVDNLAGNAFSHCKNLKRLIISAKRVNIFGPEVKNIETLRFTEHVEEIYWDFPKEQEKIGFINYTGRIKGKVGDGFDILFYEGNQKVPYLIIDKKEWVEVLEKARKESIYHYDIYDINGYLLTKLYEEKMQKKAKTDPEIARIWRAYLKRRDGDKNEQKDDIQKSEETMDGR